MIVLACITAEHELAEAFFDNPSDTKSLAFITIGGGI